MAVWTIIGTAAAGIDATPRTLAALGARTATLSLSSLSEDVLRWSTPTADPSGTGLILPDLGQAISLVRNGTTTVFRGIVTRCAPVYQGGLLHYEIEVHGPWWWLDRLQLSSDLTDSADEVSERLQFALPAGDLADSIESLIDAAAAAGAPVAFGSSATTYNLPEITLADMSYLAALAELLRYLPDSIARWDYSATTPELVVTRRGSTSTVSLALGTDTIETIDLAPELRLEAAATEVIYAERLPTGAVAYNLHSTERVRATLTTAMTGSDNDITLTARLPGAAGNSITFAINSTTSNPDLEIRRVGTAITVYRAAATTASEVVDAINSAPEMRASDSVAVGFDSLWIRAVEPGSAGNGITLTWSTSGGTTTPVVTVSGRAITVTASIDALASAAVDAINAHPGASLLVTAEIIGTTSPGAYVPSTAMETEGGNAGAAALVSAAVKAGDTGAGNVATLTATALSGGSDGAAIATGKRALVCVSGPELATLLPPDEFEFFNVRSAAISGFQLHKDLNSRIRAIIDEHGDFDLSDYTSTWGAGVGWNGTPPTTRDALGNLSSGVSYYLRSPAPLPDWVWLDTPYRFQPIAREGTYYYSLGTGWLYASGTALEKAIYDGADGIKVIGAGTYQGTWAIYTLSTQATGTDHYWPSTRPIYRPAGWEFSAPPADLAANLQAAQAWIPYAGRVTLRGSEADPAAYLGKVLNISGGPTEWSTCKALITGCDISLGRQSITIVAGLPARVDSATLSRRFRRAPRDNVRYL